jgi:hypothetical protein
MTKVQAVLDRATSDPTFRGRLKTDPVAAFEEAGLKLPTGASVEVIDTHRGDIHLLLGGRTNIPELDRIAERANNDAAFKRSLLHDSRAALEQHIGAKLPPTCTVNVREAAPNTIYLYLSDSPAGPEALTDDELEAVSGGVTDIAGRLLQGVNAIAEAVGDQTRQAAFIRAFSESDDPWD